MANSVVESIAHPASTLPSILRDSARAFPDEPYLVEPGGESMTRAKLDAEASRFANALLALGLPERSAIGIFGPNSFDFVVAGYGILRSGHVFTPFNSSYKRRELLHQIHTSGASAVFVDASLLETITACGGDLGECRIIPLERAFWRDASPSDPAIESDREKDVAFLPYSSGTTGLSKGVMLTQANLVAAIRQCLFTQGNTVGEVSMYCFLPLYHIYGFNVIVNTALASGGSIHLRARFDMDDCLDTIEREQIQGLPTVPPVLLGLAARPDLADRDLTSLEWISCGAAPVSIAACHRLRDTTGVPVRQGYGMTETAGIATLNGIDGLHDPAASAGTAVDGLDVAIRDADTGDRSLAVGEIGEVVLHGPNIMLGYYNQPEENARVLRDGWFFTGDIGKIDSDGRLHIVDRKKEMIKYKGFQVMPAELEAVMLELPDIRDCAVIGVKDPEAVEIPKAFIVLKPESDLTAEQIQAHVASQVAGYKRIRLVEFVDSIPRSPAGKILRRVLAEGA